jgi:hypothetical protein
VTAFRRDAFDVTEDAFAMLAVRHDRFGLRAPAPG